MLSSFAGIYRAERMLRVRAEVRAHERICILQDLFVRGLSAETVERDR